eukprot:GHVL01014622.1.p1 GENE.GHVL01014622.1~~GHVL01014622.1.p1  ORF type:complete len:376 (+),score=48.62 GHVL01014622.1:110-1237(+)
MTMLLGIFQSWVKELINEHITDYVEGITTDQMQLGFSTGAEFTDLILKASGINEDLEEAESPVRMVDGTIKKLILKPKGFSGAFTVEATGLSVTLQYVGKKKFNEPVPMPVMVVPEMPKQNFSPLPVAADADFAAGVNARNGEIQRKEVAVVEQTVAYCKSARSMGVEVTRPMARTTERSVKHNYTDNIPNNIKRRPPRNNNGRSPPQPENVSTCRNHYMRENNPSNVNRHDNAQPLMSVRSACPPGSPLMQAPPQSHILQHQMQMQRQQQMAALSQPVNQCHPPSGQYSGDMMQLPTNRDFNPSMLYRCPNPQIRPFTPFLGTSNANRSGNNGLLPPVHQSANPNLQYPGPSNGFGRLQSSPVIGSPSLKSVIV